MRVIKIKVNTQFIYFIFVLITLTVGCVKMSEYVEDKSAGLNGSFEVSENGLPVNWIMYTPNTIPDADFQIILDKDIFKEGKQSLKFEVERCSSTGGWPRYTD